MRVPFMRVIGSSVMISSNDAQKSSEALYLYFCIIHIQESEEF